MNAQEDMHWIEIRHVPDCPLVGQVRATLGRALALAQVHAEVKELVGEYPSPTLLIDGHDVTGRPAEECACCRLDLPTEQQVLAALRMSLQGVVDGTG